ncbi:restriction endonuclease subunit S [Mucilaginibacter sp.]|uniref:restriction endonuclease subunit S n=1 Tax=Mucilaginibacter sp. TaxID=1882438 RepID=UPI0032666440
MRFPEFEDQWQVRKLGEICKIYDGTHQTPNYVQSGISFYSVENITSDNFKNTKYVSEAVYEKENKRVKIEKGDILMTRIGDIGTSKYVDWDVKASFYVSVALIKQSLGVDMRYLNQFISTNFFQRELWNRTIHVAFPKKINLGEISECVVFVPCIREQNKIASLLTLIDTRIHTQSKIIKDLKFFKSKLNKKIFNQQLRFADNIIQQHDWQIKKLGEVCKIIGGGTPETNKSEYWNGDIQWFTPTEIKTNYVRKSQRTITSLGLNNSSAKLLPKGAILLTTRATIGEVAIALEECSTNQGFQSLIPNEGINGVFIFNWLKENKYELVKRANGSTFSEISKSELEGINIAIPSLSEQTKISSCFSLIDTKIENEERLLRLLEYQKQSLLRELFV